MRQDQKELSDDDCACASDKDKEADEDHNGPPLAKRRSPCALAELLGNTFGDVGSR